MDTSNLSESQKQILSVLLNLNEANPLLEKWHLFNNGEVVTMSGLTSVHQGLVIVGRYFPLQVSDINRTGLFYSKKDVVEGDLTKLRIAGKKIDTLREYSIACCRILESFLGLEIIHELYNIK